MVLSQSDYSSLRFLTQPPLEAFESSDCSWRYTSSSSRNCVMDRVEPKTSLSLDQMLLVGVQLHTIASMTVEISRPESSPVPAVVEVAWLLVVFVSRFFISSSASSSLVISCFLALAYSDFQSCQFSLYHVSSDSCSFSSFLRRLKISSELVHFLRKFHFTNLRFCSDLLNSFILLQNVHGFEVNFFCILLNTV